MAIWQIVTEKQLGTEYWVNDWYVSAPDQLTAQGHAADIIALEALAYMDIITITKFRVRRADLPGSQGTVFQVGTQGIRPAQAYLPLFNVVRLDLTVTTGRPGRKYMKMPIAEGWQENGVLTTAYLNDVNTTLAQPLLALGVLTQADGDVVQSIAASPIVGMRQLRRGSRKRTQPVI